MKKISILSASAALLCLCAVFSGCSKSPADSVAETTAERISAWRETKPEEETTLPETTEKTTETSAVKKTTESTVATSTTKATTQTTKATARTTKTTTTTSAVTTKATAKETQSAAASPAPTEAVPVQETAQTTTQAVAEVQAASPAPWQSINTPASILAVPVAAETVEPAATVQGAGEEAVDVPADGVYQLVNLEENRAQNTLPNDYSYWVTPSKKVLDYALPCAYFIDEQNGLVYFYKEDGSESFILSYQDYILLCNCVMHEYGNADYIPTYERSLVVEVVMNRYWNWGYSSIYDTITARNAFSGSASYADLDYVTGGNWNNAEDAVIMFFCNYDNPDYYKEGYYYFTGDGVWNHFRTTYR